MATLAGISRSKGEFIITIDDDMEYETKDILKLIEHQHAHGQDIVYGIPVQKKNKNLSYKLFFRIRNAIMHVFFNKIQTESFKIFKRRIYLDENDNMRSFLHFEAFTKFTIAEYNTGSIDVGYRGRYEGNSNHTIWMKIKILDRYGIEYFSSPFRILIYGLLLGGFLYILRPVLHTPENVQLLINLFILTNIALFVGVLGKYLSSIYFKIKGLSEFVIIEEH